MSNKQFLLNQDKIENRQFKFYVEGVLITQENDTNPRIRRVSQRTGNEFITISETLPEYEVRIINYPGMPVFNPSSKYEIEFTTNQKVLYKSVDIRRSYENDMYTTIYVARELADS
jgi:hypothetical protein